MSKSKPQRAAAGPGLAAAVASESQGAADTEKAGAASLADIPEGLKALIPPEFVLSNEIQTGSVADRGDQQSGDGQGEGAQGESQVSGEAVSQTVDFHPSAVVNPPDPLYPREVTLRNDGEWLVAEPITGKTLPAGGSERVVLHDAKQAQLVLENLAFLSARHCIPEGKLRIEGLPALPETDTQAG